MKEKPPKQTPCERPTDEMETGVEIVATGVTTSKVVAEGADSNLFLRYQLYIYVKRPI